MTKNEFKRLLTLHFIIEMGYLDKEEYSVDSLISLVNKIADGLETDEKCNCEVEEEVRTDTDSIKDIMERIREINEGQKEKKSSPFDGIFTGDQPQDYIITLCGCNNG